MKTCLLSFLGLLLCFGACRPLPGERLLQARIKGDYYVQDGYLKLELSNPLHCPLRLDAHCVRDSVNQLLNQAFPFVMPSLRDTSFQFATKISGDSIDIQFSYTFGDPRSKIQPRDLALPFLSGHTYKVIQAYNGTFSHNSDYSRYAIDFGLSVGDTVCAAYDGFVVGVIEGYQYGGDHPKWRDYANFITLYHPEPGWFTQYVHLDHMGSLVSLGDSVKMHQPIGISGMTGFTSVAHLHFNVLQPTAEGMASVPTGFTAGYEGKALKRGDRVAKP